MNAQFQRIWLTTKIFFDLVALLALCVWFAEPFGWIWRAGSAIALAAIWAIVFKLCGIIRVRAGAGHADHGKAIARKRPTVTDETSPEKPLREVLLRKPPKSARYTWTLTENGVPVGVEYNKRAVENWMALGPEFDAEAHKLN